MAANNNHRDHILQVAMEHHLAATEPTLIRLEPEHYLRQALAGRGLDRNDGEAGDVGNIGDFNHAVNMPIQMNHNGGGDADAFFDPVVPAIVGQEQGAGDAVGLQQHLPAGPGQGVGEAAQPQGMLMMMRLSRMWRETREQRRWRNIQSIIRLCSFIQLQLVTIAAQMDSYEKKLAQYDALLSSLSPPDPDGDAL